MVPSDGSMPLAGGEALAFSRAASTLASLSRLAHTTTAWSPAAVREAHFPRATVHVGDAGQPALSSARVRIAVPSIHIATAPEVVATMAKRSRASPPAPPTTVQA